MGKTGPSSALSRETNSGTHVYFLEQVLRLGEEDNKTMFSPDTLLLPSSQGITSEVRDNPNAIGYDGLGYVTPDVKVIAVASEDQGAYIMPSAETREPGHISDCPRSVHVHSRRTQALNPGIPGLDRIC